jgi:hypothetical protein
MAMRLAQALALLLFDVVRQCVVQLGLPRYQLHHQPRLPDTRSCTRSPSPFVQCVTEATRRMSVLTRRPTLDDASCCMIPPLPASHVTCRQRVLGAAITISLR